MRKGKTKNGRKYRILEFLKALPYDEYRIARKNLPIALEISKRTFERWLYLTTDSKMQIPADKLAILSNYFKLDSMEQLINYKVKQLNIEQLRRLGVKKRKDLIKEFNLIQ